MGLTYDEVRKGAPWSLSILMHSQLDVLDAEGRPLGEVRAASLAKKGVPMLLKTCPYHDDRRGRPMNVSALEQTTKHLKLVLVDIEDFRRARADLCGRYVAPMAGREDEIPQQPDLDWTGLMEGVLDQLTAPARFLLRSDDPKPLVTGQMAVSHKLAAGYFGVLRRILEDEALGRARRVGVDEFLVAVAEQKALTGASEICAGPPNMIRRCTEAFFSPLCAPVEAKTQHAEIFRSRVEVAQLLSRQLAVGTALGLFDRLLERHFFERYGDLLEFKNDHFAMKTRGRACHVLAGEQLRTEAPRIALGGKENRGPLPELFEAGCSPQHTLLGGSPPSPALRALLSQETSAMAIAAEWHSRLIRDMELYFQVLSLCTQRQWKLEMAIRERLGMAREQGMRQSALQRPLLKTLDCYEALLGAKVTCDPCARPRVMLRVLG